MCMLATGLAFIFATIISIFVEIPVPPSTFAITIVAGFLFVLFALILSILQTTLELKSTKENGVEKFEA
jgi:uncharacterized protein YhhL (DUF1145 family)